MYKFSFAYEVILKETQPKVGLSKSSGSDQKQTRRLLSDLVAYHFPVYLRVPKVYIVPSPAHLSHYG